MTVRSWTAAAIGLCGMMLLFAGGARAAENEAAIKDMAARLLEFRKSDAYVAVLLKTARAIDERVAPLCADRKPKGRTLVAVLEPVEFLEDIKQPVKGHWAERVSIERCGKTVYQNIFFFAGKKGLATLAGIPGLTLSGLRLQQQTSRAILTKNRKLAQDCEDRLVTGAELTAQPADKSSPWTERWTVTACEKETNYNIKFTPQPAGGVGFQIIN